MKAYKLLPSLIDEATLNVSKLCEHNLECVLIGKAQHSLYRNCLKGTLVVIIISYSLSEIGLLRIMKPSENRKTHGSASVFCPDSSGVIFSSSSSSPSGLELSFHPSPHHHHLWSCHRLLRHQKDLSPFLLYFILQS